VRDWATFGLGTQIDTDTPEIREALHQRLNDPDADTRAEAMVGLARRKDLSALEPILEGLSGDEVDDLVIEAAAELGDPRLLPALVELKSKWSETSGDIAYLKTRSRVARVARPRCA
jgi:HEAT repeat protein